MTLRFQPRARRYVDHLIGEATHDDPSADDAAFVQRTQDPFGVADRCQFNPAGHVAMQSCGAIVCQYCGKVFWQ